MPATSRSQQRDRTRQHLLETTVACLVEYGYAGTTTQRIQDRAGLSRGALLHHFHSKADLFAAAVGYLAQLQITEIAAALETGPDTPGTRLGAVRGAMSGPAFQAALELWMAARTDPALHAALLPSQREIGRAVRELLAREFADRDPGEARVAYESLLMLLRGLALTSALRDDPALTDDILTLWLTRVLPAPAEPA
ncbi:MAG TPA: TetR/AcrR family transcriptional regulator [Pseudonocardia sp.]|jgi:AcrR family transcriptional regulator|nr:TetR/AcrR family transcriptional regulator [Pseudonocardia sp.]